MSTAHVLSGARGATQGALNQEILAAPGANKKYEITDFSIDYYFVPVGNDPGGYAYIYQDPLGDDSNAGKNTFRVSLVSGNITIYTKVMSRYICDQSYSYGRYPFAWSGSIYCPANTPLYWKIELITATRTIRNRYYVDVTYNILNRPIINKNDLIQATDMNILKSWATTSTDVIQNNKILQTEGNAFYANSLENNPIITADWYNSVP